jgi:hypothetical protein
MFRTILVLIAMAVCLVACGLMNSADIAAGLMPR